MRGRLGSLRRQCRALAQINGVAEGCLDLILHSLDFEKRVLATWRKLKQQVHIALRARFAPRYRSEDPKSRDVTVT